jgi:hypothetical protein
MCGNSIVNCIGYFFKVENYGGLHAMNLQWYYWYHVAILDSKLILMRIQNFQCGNISHVLHESIIYLNEFTRWVNYMVWNTMVQNLFKISSYLIISGLCYNWHATKVVMHVWGFIFCENSWSDDHYSNILSVCMSTNIVTKTYFTFLLFI